MADDIVNTNAYLATQMALTIQQYLNYANTDIIIYTTPPDGGPFGNGYVQFVSVTNGTIWQPSYPTLANTLVGPAQQSSDAANAAIIANTNANIANVGAWDAVDAVLLANTDAVQANTNAQIANTNAWQAESDTANTYTLVLIQNSFVNATTVDAEMANTNAWVAADAAEEANTMAWAALSNASGVFAANASAWEAESLASLANFLAQGANTNAQIANTNANIANTMAWAALSNASGVFAANASAWVAAGEAEVANAMTWAAVSNASNSGVFTANTNAWIAEGFAVTANTNAQIANTNAWAAYTNFVTTGTIDASLEVVSPMNQALVLLYDNCLLEAVRLNGAVGTRGFSLASIDAQANTGSNLAPFTIGATTILANDGTRQFPVSRKFAEPFANSNLTAGVLTINHFLGEQFPSVVIANGTNVRVTPDSVTFTNTNVCSVNLSSQGTISGTWHAIVFG